MLVNMGNKNFSEIFGWLLSVPYGCKLPGVSHISCLIWQIYYYFLIIHKIIKWQTNNFKTKEMVQCVDELEEESVTF